MKKSKDVLFLLQFFYPEYISSATLPFDTASKLAEEGMTVDVICGCPHEYNDVDNVPKKETVNKVNIHRVRYLQLDRKRVIGRLINYFSLTIAIFFQLFSMRKYKTIVVYSNPPILPLIGAWASKLFGAKLVFVAYDLYPEIAIRTNSLSEKSIITKLMHYINNIVFDTAEAVVALSSEMKEYIVENRKISNKKVHIIPNWFRDQCKIYNNENNVFQNIVNNRFVVGYFGNMGIAQNMEPIVQAMRFYKNDSDICFLLAGHGSKYLDIKKMIEIEELENVYLYEFLKEKEYLDALKASDCAIVSLEKGLTGLCVPSKTYGYMMQGTPVIAIIEHSDIAGDMNLGAGICIDGTVTSQLIEAVEKIRRNPVERLKMGEMSRKIYLKKYTPELCVNKYVELFKRILL